MPDDLQEPLSTAEVCAVIAQSFRDIGRSSADAAKLISVADACEWAATVVEASSTLDAFQNAMEAR